MNFGTHISMKNSIATRMLLVVLGLYLLIATAVTLSHIWIEYRYQKNNIIHDLEDIESAFVDGLAVSLWGLDEEDLRASVEGMLRIPTVVGVKVSIADGTLVALGGIVAERGETGNVGLHVSLSGLSDADIAVHNGKPYNLEMLERQFPIEFNFKGENRLLGRATIYSNSSVIYRGMKVQITMLAVNLILTLLTFFLALLWAVKRYLRKPLAAMVSATEKVSLENLETFKVDIGATGGSELKILEESFNSMIGNLHQSMVRREMAEESMKIFRSAAEASSDAIGMATVAGKHYYQNEAFDRMFGDIGDDPQATAYVDQAVGREVFQKIMAGGQWIGEVKMRGVGNNILDILLRAYAVVDEDGRVVNLVGVHTDITVQKQAEMNLAAEKERLAVTLRSIGDGVITSDINGKIVLLNKVAESLTGWSQDEAAGRSLEEVFNIINEQTRKVCENPVKKVLSSGRIIGLANHTLLIARDGVERSIADSGAPILDADSNIIGVVLVFRDVTDQLKTEKELLKVKKLESIGVLAGGIAHDFNNILAAILGNINLALFDEDLSGDTKKLLSEAEKASVRAKGLTQQLLTFAKGGEPVKKASSLAGVIMDSANFILRGDKVSCRYDIPESLWLVDIDEGQVSQVIQNIVLNASNAMAEGGIVDIACENILVGAGDDLPYEKEQRLVKILIRDGGIGIPAHIVEEIFDPYFTTKQEGSGLGLAISQSIINKHNGHISVESAPGVGTTFTILLPASEKKKVEEPEATPASVALLKAKILIMDDEEMVRTVAKRMLNKLGHEVAVAEDGAEVLKLYRESMDMGEPFDLVIMDLTIPGGMGGEEAVKEIHKLDQTVKVIVSSGYSNDPIMANCNDFGFCSAIVKPFLLQDLSRVLSEVLR